MKVYLRKLKNTSSARHKYTTFCHLSTTDLQNLKLAKEEEEKLQEAQELTENKAILEEIELREKEEEMRTQEAERKYNQVHQRFKRLLIRK